MSTLKSAWPWFVLGVVLSAVGLVVLGAAGAIVLAVGLLMIFAGWRPRHQPERPQTTG
jgi:hypothetical protein